MSITDELRERIDDEALLLSTRRELWNIADRIDAEHESKVSYWQGASYKDGYDEGSADILAFCDRLKEAAESREDVTLWGTDYVALPVDADNVPIHVGDVMCNTHKDGFMAKRVTGLCVHSSGRWTVEVDEAKLRWHDADKLHHYTPPTVEDVLRAMLDALDVDVCADPDATIAEYAAKLRLRGEDE